LLRPAGAAAAVEWERDLDKEVPKATPGSPPSPTSLYADQGTALTVRALLSDLFEARSAELDGGVNVLRFRAKHDEKLEILNDMAAVGWIEQRDRFYYDTLAGLSELAATKRRAASLLNLCRRAFHCLRRQYKRDPEGQIAVTELAKLLKMPLERVNRALPYLRQASIFAGSSIDLNQPDAYIIPSEDLIRQKSLDAIIEQHRSWIADRIRHRAALAGPGPVQLAQPAGATESDRATFRTPFESYIAVKQVGQGGSGQVWSATDEGGKLVAIKCLDPGKSTERRTQRFRNEVRFGQRASHPNIVPILDVGERVVQGVWTPFFVMPLYELTLRRAMRDGIAPERVLSVFEKVLAGVAAAHAQDVWHRDLKPENILLSADLAEVRIADFGIAHFEQQELYSAAQTKTADRLANFRYAAPEQRDPAADKDHRADIFALGLILNEMFTGEVPHGTAYRKIVSVNSEYGYLDSLVDRLIRQRPEERPQTAAEVHRLLYEPPVRSDTRESSTVFFSKRFAKAFPGMRGIEEFSDPRQMRARLEMLLKAPLVFGHSGPIWWWRKGEMLIKKALFLDDSTLLINEEELLPDRLVAVNAGSYYQKFVYLQTRPSTPTGLYDPAGIDTAVMIAGFAREEFALYRGHLVSREEYDDGAAVIDGLPVTFEERPELRVRYLTPYNLLIAANDSPINSLDFDETRDAIMDRMLRGEADLEELVDEVLKLPKDPVRR
jgi:serine/threonine protein kinase